MEFEFKRIIVSVCAAFLSLATFADDGLKLASDGKVSATIVVAKDASLQEGTAAEELAAYLKKITGAEFPIKNETDPAIAGSRIFIGATEQAKKAFPELAKFGSEEWAIRSVGNDLVLTGGHPRGTLYAVYRFLEDDLGVHWWNPWEETVPSKPTLAVAGLNRRGQPAFRYRDIGMVYGNDAGRFAARNNLNRQGDNSLASRYGGGVVYGRPFFVHTFFRNLPPAKYFAAHPEWYALIKGKRSDKGQLCLTNPEMRKEMIRITKDYIRGDRASAAKTGTPAPLVYSISQEDNESPCQCAECQAIAKAEGSEAGPLLDFVNAVADAVKDDAPEVFIDTLAYNYSQKPPKNLRARDNVVVRLCDTRSVFNLPITAPKNKSFHDLILEWAKIAKNIWVWDYAVTYAAPIGLPFPSVNTYGEDYRFYAAHNVEGVLSEFEYPILADLRDLKVWMMIKLLNDPNADYAKLLATFTDGFYGPAGTHVRDYLAKLEAAAVKHNAQIGFASLTPKFTYLDLDFILAAQAIFDQAEKAVGSDAMLLRRIRHARLPLDRATVILLRRFTKEWVERGNTPETLPLDRDAILKRVSDTWTAQIALRMADEKLIAMEKAALDAEIAAYSKVALFTPLPEQFRKLPKDAVWDFQADMMRRYGGALGLVEDPTAETGITLRIEFPTPEKPEYHLLEKYQMPMKWGVYVYPSKDGKPTDGTGIGASEIKAVDVPGPGYHWYKLVSNHKLGPDSKHLWFHWSWIIQCQGIEIVHDPKNPDQTFDIWARIKFEGLAFPHGNPAHKDAISVERAVIVKSDAAAPTSIGTCP